MTPDQIENMARQRMNVVGDTFWSSDEIWNLNYQAQLELAKEAHCIEKTQTTLSVVGQQAYDYPSTTISIKRLTYDGRKLTKITMREDDALTLNDSDTTTTGDPQFYFEWDNKCYLRPIPDTDGLTIKIFSYHNPNPSIYYGMEVPVEFHLDIVNFILSAMSAKEGDWKRSQYHQNLWEKAVVKAKQWNRKRLRGDTFATVQDSESALSTIGIV